MLNIITDVNSVVDLMVIWGSLIFVEFVLGSTQENDLLCDWRKQVGSFLIFLLFYIMSMVNAPVHDLLIRIKNGYLARRPQVEWVVSSKLKIAVCELLKKYKFIVDFTVVDIDGKNFLTIDLNKFRSATEDIPVIKFHSKPSRRVYVSYHDLKPVAGHGGIGIISTNQWLMASHVAKQLKIGGELIAEIY